ncbi:IAA-alanine resistance protein 1-like [Rutidosis leptorrhynchoides]|uniref:IAA-alanine resistance protein 1-like n=1 Tax=Rutidosis leptorrhynchoides TaxID=125765 RepID=UPI003A99B013
MEDHNAYFKPYYCQWCNKGYGPKTGMEDHNNNKHEEKCYLCKECLNVFMTATKLAEQKCLVNHYVQVFLLSPPTIGPIILPTNHKGLSQPKSRKNSCKVVVGKVNFWVETYDAKWKVALAYDMMCCKLQITNQQLNMQSWFATSPLKAPASVAPNLFLIFVFGLCLDLVIGSGSCMSPAVEHHHDHHHDHHNCDHHHHGIEKEETFSKLLPEELAEEEDMKLYGFGPINGDHHHDQAHGHDSNLSGLGLWVNALGCSLLVSLASLVCLILLPILFVHGKPSKAVVDSLALFGAGAMLGDAFLHQLPHAFGGKHSPAHDDHHAHDSHSDYSGHSHGHAHSISELSVGLSVLAGIVLFLLVEKMVRYVEENSGGANTWGHGHRHHHHKSSQKKKSKSSRKAKGKKASSDEALSDSLNRDIMKEESLLRKRKTSSAGPGDSKSDDDASDESNRADSLKKETAHSPSNLVFGYLNLFSDGVHNFTDGMALGSAFLLYGSVGGWSRTLFLLAHELPQEIGDFGILVRSGFSVSKALFFNFLSALVALFGTALALLWGQDPGHSSLIEGLTAGGFIYIAVAGVLAEMNNNGKSTLTSTAAQLTSLILGMAVALGISLVE